MSKDKTALHTYAEYKFRPFTNIWHEYYNPLIHNVFFMLWNHWLNPFGNWHEPLPFPEKNARAAAASWLHPAVWWALRNPLHNFSHFWVGIVPVFRRYVWITPDFYDWDRKYYNSEGLMAAWAKTFHIFGHPVRMFLPFYHWNFGTWGDTCFEFAAGWRRRGNFTVTFRRSSE